MVKKYSPCVAFSFSVMKSSNDFQVQNMKLMIPTKLFQNESTFSHFFSGFPLEKLWGQRFIGYDVPIFYHFLSISLKKLS